MQAEYLHPCHIGGKPQKTSVKDVQKNGDLILHMGIVIRAKHADAVLSGLSSGRDVIRSCGVHQDNDVLLMPAVKADGEAKGGFLISRLAVTVDDQEAVSQDHSIQGRAQSEDAGR